MDMDPDRDFCMDSDTQKTNADPQHWCHHEQREMYCKKSKLNKNRIELKYTTLEKRKSRIPDRKFRESSPFGTSKNSAGFNANFDRS